MVSWKKSKLHYGQLIRIQEKLLVATGKRLIKTRYIGETNYGICLRLLFEPGPCTEDSKWYYDTFISWPSIFCGDVKLQTYDGETIKAELAY